MFKKMFALASVTALTGLVATVAAAGCSSTTTAAGTDTDAAVATGDAAVKPKDAAPADPDTGVGPATCPTTDAITVADVEASFKWNPPAAPQSVCTQKNLDDLRALFKTGMGSAKFTDIQTTLGTTCGACVFTPSTATAWGLFLTDTSGKVVGDNSGPSCLAQIDSAACGKADAEFTACTDSACADCATDQATIDACTTKAAKGACKAVTAAAGTACTKTAEAKTFCSDTLSIIAVSCGGGPDGGLDASQ